MHTILGPNGAIGDALVAALSNVGLRIRLVSREPRPVAGAETVVADLADLDQTVNAVTGSQVVYLLIGLKYELRIWRELWPRIMRNVIEACKRADVKLIFFDNVYAYARGRSDDRANAVQPVQSQGRDTRGNRHHAGQRSQGAT